MQPEQSIQPLNVAAATPLVPIPTFQIALSLSESHGAAFRESIKSTQKKFRKISFFPPDSNFGVDGSTFRAYTGWEMPPSTTYRAWALSICKSIVPQSLAEEIRRPEGFFGWHGHLATSLNDHWEHYQGRKLSFAHQHKLVDLFIKWLSLHDFGPPTLSSAIEMHANCALDSQTLSKLNECISFILPMSNPTMGNIKTRETYDFCQRLITEFATRNGGTRLHFDFFAWQRGGSR